MKPRGWIRAAYLDYRRYRATGGKQGSALGVILFAQGFWATTLFRLSHRLIQIQMPYLRTSIKLLVILLQKWSEITTGISIPAECQIGQGLYIGHFGTVILNQQVIIGDNCNLSQGVTIGVLNRGKRMGTPRIGNRVYIGPNAVVAGGIVIGDDVAIGAGAVVTHSVPDRAVVAGNPASVISFAGSFEYIKYDDMLNDPERVQSLNTRDQDAAYRHISQD